MPKSCLITRTVRRVRIAKIVNDQMFVIFDQLNANGKWIGLDFKAPL